MSNSAVTTHPTGPAAWFRGTMHLAGVSFWRLLRSRQTIISLMLLGFVVALVMAWSMRRSRSAEDLVEHILMVLYVSFLMPVFCLAYASASVAGDREEGTLVYLLIRPLPRPLVHLAKYLSALALSLGWSLGAMFGFCQVAGTEGRLVFATLWPAAVLGTLAYVSLFHLLSVWFRRATLVALGYAVFFEVLVGNMPGIVKRVAVSFYVKCLVLEWSAPFGVEQSQRQATLFQPVSAQMAMIVLAGVALGLFLIGTWAFSRREYA